MRTEPEIGGLYRFNGTASDFFDIQPSYMVWDMPPMLLLNTVLPPVWQGATMMTQINPYADLFVVLQITDIDCNKGRVVKVLTTDGVIGWIHLIHNEELAEVKE